MPSFTLQVLFSGLIAYSPNAQNPPTQATIMALNDINSRHMPHQTFLSVHKDQLISSDLPFEFDPTDPSGFRKRTFVGGGYVLSIEGLPSGAFDYQECRDMPPRTGKPPVETCLLKASQLRSTNLSPDNSALSGTDFKAAANVALRFAVDSGKLWPFEGEVEPFAREVKWTFSGDQKQFVPEQMEWISPTLNMANVTLVLTPMGGGLPRKIVLELRAEPLISLMISNEPDARDFCAMGYDRYFVTHLNLLARFSGGSPTATVKPMLADETEIRAIDKACAGLGRAGGRSPIICYGNQMP